MKIINNIAAQGDLIIRRVKALPENTKIVEESKSIVVAHSETGHNHVAVCEKKMTRFEVPGDALKSYLKAGDDVDHFDVEHMRSFDTHETLRFLCNPGDVFEVRRQREWTPEGWKRVED